MTNAEEEKQREVRRIVSLALAEDLDLAGDITSRAIFDADEPGAARIVTREACTVSGLKAAAEVCLQVDPDLSWLPLVRDGDPVVAGAMIARLEGRIISILTAERTLLNFLSRLSGIATLTRRFADLLADLPTRIAATRKTDPGMRVLEKQAVVDGGGEPHRMGLYDAVLVKDNHIAAAGGITKAVARVRNKLGSGAYIEVEVETIKQLQEAIDANVNRVMLDNMTPEMVKSCVKLAGGRVELEASGGINLDNARDFAEAGADVISLGVLTRSAAGIDFSLEVER